MELNTRRPLLSFENISPAVVFFDMFVHFFFARLLHHTLTKCEFPFNVIMVGYFTVRINWFGLVYFSLCFNAVLRVRDRLCLKKISNFFNGVSFEFFSPEVTSNSHIYQQFSS